MDTIIADHNLKAARFTPCHLTGPKGSVSVSPELVDDLLFAVMTTDSNWGQFAVTKLYTHAGHVGYCEHDGGHDTAPITYISWYNDHSLADHHTEIKHCPVSA